MSELSPRARQVLRSSVKPATLADRERIQGALRAKLGAGALSSAGGAPLAPPRARWPFISGAIVGIGLLGGVLFFRTRPESPLPPPTHPVATAVTTDSVAPVAPAVDTSAAALPTADVAPDLPAAPSARPAQDRLAQELAFMERATSALHAGHPASALKILNEYQREFPNGTLALERRAARAQALCSLGRRSDALTELSRLPAQSPSIARAKQVCDAH